MSQAAYVPRSLLQPALSTTQTLTGTYTLQLSPQIKSAAGDMLDSNLDAGVDMLGDQASSFNDITFTNTIPAAIGGATANRITTSKITVADSFPIDGMTVQMNIEYILAHCPRMKASGLNAQITTAARAVSGVNMLKASE